MVGGSFVPPLATVTSTRFDCWRTAEVPPSQLPRPSVTDSWSSLIFFVPLSAVSIFFPLYSCWKKKRDFFLTSPTQINRRNPSSPDPYSSRAHTPTTTYPPRVSTESTVRPDSYAPIQVRRHVRPPPKLPTPCLSRPCDPLTQGIVHTEKRHRVVQICIRDLDRDIVHPRRDTRAVPSHTGRSSQSEIHAICAPFWVNGRFEDECVARHEAFEPT